jgi:hypothetical protein
MNGEEYLIGFPLALPMGWTESPKIFTAATETIADLANHSLAAGTPFGPHPLEVLSDAPHPQHQSRCPLLRPQSRRLRASSLGQHTAGPSPYGTSTLTIFGNGAGRDSNLAQSQTCPPAYIGHGPSTLGQHQFRPPPGTGFHQENGER